MFSMIKTKENESVVQTPQKGRNVQSPPQGIKELNNGAEVYFQHDSKAIFHVQLESEFRRKG